MLKESLFAMPSFLSGMARLFDFWGVFDEYNRSPSNNIADTRALGSDWRVIGEDLRQAIQQYEDSHPPVDQIDLFPHSVAE